MRSPLVLYWDSSALVSVLVPDPQREEALRWAQGPATHVISTLAWTEVLAVIARFQRERKISARAAEAAREEIGQAPWERFQDSPDWIILRELASRWTLPGADLWHLALAKTLQQERPELRLLSFDDRLSKAAAGEGLAATTPT